MTGTGLRIASASAAFVVSAAVAGAALYGGSAISDPGAPGRDDRLIAVPAPPSQSSTETPTPSLEATTSSDGSRTLLARPSAQPNKCNVHQKGSPCYRPLKSRTAASPIARSTNSPRTDPATAKRQSPSAKQSQGTTPRSTKTTAPSKTASSSSSYATRPDWANAVLDELNDERKSNRLPALKLNTELTSAAHTHNLAMAKADTLSHQLKGEPALGSRVSAAGYSWSAVGENVAYNTDRSQAGVLALQKAMYNEKPPDDGHRENILNAKFVHVGIDVINDSAHGKVWLVTDFARP